MTNTSPSLHLRLRGNIGQAGERLALRATLAASHLLGLATGTHLRALRGMPDALTHLQARLQLAELRARLASESLEILAARFAKIPERHRPYYTPAQRFRILEIKSLLAWSAQETARTFLVCTNTILNWERSADPQGQTVGSTVSPTPPIRRACDALQRLVQTMVRLGLGGDDMIARILARAGWRVSARSVGRYRRQRRLPQPHGPAPEPKVPRRPVVARFVNHVWMMDISEVKQLLGRPLHLAAVFDAFSRVTLALQVFHVRPSAADMVRLWRRAARAFGAPRHVITDLGGEFIAGAFRKAARRVGTQQRFASKDSLKATARLERFWRTLKEDAGLYRLQLPLTREDLEARLELALFHYLCFRPHEGLQGAVPAEALLRLEPEHLGAVGPPRGRHGEGPSNAPFRIDHLDPSSGRFPILIAA